MGQGVFLPQDTFRGQVNPTGILVIKFSILAGAGAREDTETSSNQEKEFNFTVSYPGLSGWKTEF